jgi:hypothetical protein
VSNSALSEGAYILGVESLGEGRKAGEIGEEDGHLSAIRLPAESLRQDCRQAPNQSELA